MDAEVVIVTVGLAVFLLQHYEAALWNLNMCPFKTVIYILVVFLWVYRKFKIMTGLRNTPREAASAPDASVVSPPSGRNY